jgi:DNA polymerase-3 subunit delta'
VPADLCVLMPEVQMMELGWPLPEKAQADIDDKKRKPSKEIRVEAMRDAVEFCQRTSARTRQGRAGLPGRANECHYRQRLAQDAGGAARRHRFVLASEAAHQLLPTIRSRCLTHTMTWPAAAEAAQWLQAQGLNEPDAAAGLQAAGGRPGDALRMAADAGKAAAWAQLPRQLAKGDVAALAAFAPVDAVQALQKICHDLMALAGGGEPGISRLPICRASRCPWRCWPNGRASWCRRRARPITPSMPG